MERIDTHRKKATAKTALLVLAALALAAVAAIFFYASLERPTAEASQPSPAEVGEATPKDEGLWLSVPKMARVKDLPVLTGPANDEAALAESALHVAGTAYEYYWNWNTR